MSGAALPTLVRCSDCSAAVPSGSYCAICGNALTSATSSSSSPASRVRGSARRLSGVYAAAAAAALAAAVLVFGVSDSYTITGDVSLFDTDMIGLSLGAPCSGFGGYDDMSAGEEVVATDGQGRTLAHSRLEAGRFDGMACVFNFSVEGVPEADFYRVSTGRSTRGDTEYSFDELVADDWAVHLELGT